MHPKRIPLSGFPDVVLHAQELFAKRHPQQIEKADARPGRKRLNPQPAVAREDREEHQRGNQQPHEQDEPNRPATKQPPAAFLRDKRRRSNSHWENMRRKLGHEPRPRIAGSTDHRTKSSTNNHL